MMVLKQEILISLGGYHYHALDCKVAVPQMTAVAGFDDYFAIPVSALKNCTNNNGIHFRPCRICHAEVIVKELEKKE